MNDAVTMVRRNTKHTLRNPSTMIMTIGLPVILLLLFVGFRPDDPRAANLAKAVRACLG